MSQFYRPVPHVTAMKVKNVDPERAIRLYCTSAGTTWSLQVRSPATRANGSDGHDFIVANAVLSVADMKALRKAIDEFLAE